MSFTTVYCLFFNRLVSLSKRGNKNESDRFHEYPQEVILYVRNSKIGKPLKAISKQTSKVDLCPISFWCQVKFLYRVERKIDFEVRVKVKLQIQPHCHTADQPPELHGDGSSKFTGGSRVATLRYEQEGHS